MTELISNDNRPVREASNIVSLEVAEKILLDDDQLAAIYRDLGAYSADQLVTRALAELALTMTSITSLVGAHEATDITRKLRRLQSMAENIGMVSLALVASDLRDCAEAQDSASFSAVWARLMRVAEKSLKPDHPFLGQSHK